MKKTGGAVTKPPGWKARPGRSWPPTLLSAFGATLVVSLLAGQAFLENVELSLLDMRFRWRGPQPATKDIVIVTIDQTSESDLDEPYPWNRRFHARLVDNLRRAGARLIVFDVVFTEGEDPAGTAILAEAIGRAGNVILAGKTDTAVLGQASAIGVKPPLPLLAERAWGWGLIDQYADTDNAVRRYGITTDLGGRQYATLACKILLAYQGLPPDAPLEDGPREARLGDYRVPKYDRQTMLINYCGPTGSFSQYSFSCVLDDSDFTLPREDADLDTFDDWLRAGIFRGKIVLVGATARELHDFIRTPFFGAGEEKVLTPGVEMHANALNTILTGSYIYRPTQASPWFRPLLALLWAFMACFLAGRTTAVRGLLVGGGLAAGEVALAFWIFQAQGWWLDIVAPVLATGLAYMGQTTWMVLAEQRAKRLIRGMFAQYVSSQVVEEIIRRPELLTLGGEERVLTVVFSDVESFTTISENMAPRELANHLNDYLTAMSEIILRHQGIIDKFEGDAIMAEFGAPVPLEDHARQACLAALEMQERLRVLEQEWTQRGLPAWRCRIGVHTGSMIVGNMGSRDLFDYTVLGDNVNLGSRLETANKIYGTRIMVSEATLAAAGEDLLARELDDIVVKGKTKPVKVFELVGLKEKGLPLDRERLLGIYRRAMAAAAAGGWSEAVELFDEALVLDPADGPSRFQRDRAARRLRERDEAAPSSSAGAGTQTG